MSFILDALKKSETERQQQGSAEFAKVPSSSGAARAPRWLLVLGLLLAINLIVLLGLLLRSPADSTVAQTLPVPLTTEDGAYPTAIPKPVPQAEAIDLDRESTSFADQVAEAKRNNPVPDSADRNADAYPRSGANPVARPAVATAAAPAETAALPSIYEVVADGSVALPELHLDIHVYSEVPQDRFVFVNMSKHRENSQLDEGPVVEEITPDGVILNYRGKSFLLPRD